LWATGRIAQGEYIKFPHARQVFRIETDVEIKKRDGSSQHRHEIHFGVTSLSRSRADRARLLDLHRKHWSIENKLHWVRDVTFDEDRSQVRKGAAPQAMASLRNIALNLLRLAGTENIARATRHCARHPATTLRLMGIPTAA